MELLELGERGACDRRRPPAVEAAVGPGGRVQYGPVLRRAERPGGTGPAHFSGEGEALCLTTVVRHGLGLRWDDLEFDECG